MTTNLVNKNLLLVAIMALASACGCDPSVPSAPDADAMVEVDAGTDATDSIDAMVDAMIQEDAMVPMDAGMDSNVDSGSQCLEVLVMNPDFSDSAHTDAFRLNVSYVSSVTVSSICNDPAIIITWADSLAYELGTTWHPISELVNKDILTGSLWIRQTRLAGAPNMCTSNGSLALGVDVFTCE